mmetsp:Transcript_26911/g.31093  ORF Transcript_26911/g.31093 Transcript_26911/m.31093 type:complete len:277 (-) Transcript_26911:277-1107(-)
MHKLLFKFLLATFVSTIAAFPVAVPQSKPCNVAFSLQRKQYIFRPKSFNLSIRSRPDSIEDDYSDDEIEDDEPITKEEFLRDMLADPKNNEVKRKTKKKGSRYRTMDNRDSLPFVVQVTTPDPYANRELIKKEAMRNTKNEEGRNKGTKSKKNNGNKVKRKANLVGMDPKFGIASALYETQNDKNGAKENPKKLLGEFNLEKSTTCGDRIMVGETEFIVEKARCQYKYAGGKRFVMVRKILEVKEVSRAETEEKLVNIYSKNIDEPPEQEDESIFE